MMTESKPNPLLQDVSSVPPFDVIEPEHVASGIRALLAEVEAMLEELEANGTSSWEGIARRARSERDVESSRSSGCMTASDLVGASSSI